MDILDKSHLPVLLLDEITVRKNIRQMKERTSPCVLQPHVKTHQSLEIGRWMQDEGITAITVSSVGMAEYFVEDGWKDVTIAFPFNIHELNRIRPLVNKAAITLLTDQEAVIDEIGKSGLAVGLVIEIDTGSHRTGIFYEHRDKVESLIRKVKSHPCITFKGLYSHAGHTYGCRSEGEIKEVGGRAITGISQLQDLLKGDEKIHYGDTPTCSVLRDLGNISVVTPGNFVFYDAMQMEIGSCAWENIAVVLACPVVATMENRRQIAVHCGAIHLSKDRLDGGIFGLMVKLTEDGWSAPLPKCVVQSISQEHGIVSLSEAENGNWQPGETIGIIPVHSCLTAECIGGYTTLKGQKIDHFAQKKQAG